MKTQELESATGTIADFVQGAQSEPVVFTVSGKPVAALVPMSGADAETASLSMNAQFLSLIERSRSRLAQEGGVTTDEMRRRLGL